MEPRLFPLINYKIAFSRKVVLKGLVALIKKINIPIALNPILNNYPKSPPNPGNRIFAYFLGFGIFNIFSFSKSIFYNFLNIRIKDIFL